MEKKVRDIDDDEKCCLSFKLFAGFAKKTRVKS
jgi:hypothetical protein